MSLDLDAQTTRFVELNYSPEAERLRRVLADACHEARRAGLVLEVGFHVMPDTRSYQSVIVRPARWGYTNPKKEA